MAAKEVMETLQVIRGAEWVDVPMKDIKAGDLFRAFHADGVPFMMGGATTFEASSDAYKKNGDWAISAVDPSKQKD